MTGTSSDGELLRQVVHALLLEWTSDVEVGRGMDYVDFVTSSLAPLGIQTRQRFRLFTEPVDDAAITDLRELAAKGNEWPVAIAPEGSTATRGGVPVMGLAELAELADQSGVVSRRRSGEWVIDGLALGDLAENDDTRLTLVNGLLWLRALARDRVPPALRMTRRPAYELFERCFFTVMSTTFGARGTSWGTERRGQVRPDGLLNLPNVARQVIYDCKASFEGYAPTYRDMLGFADYVRAPTGWTLTPGTQPRFLLVSSSFRMSGAGSFGHRQEQLTRKLPGVGLSTIRARDLVRFAVQLERANVPLEGRVAVNWEQILAAGEVTWADFELQREALEASGYTMAT